MDRRASPRRWRDPATALGERHDALRAGIAAHLSDLDDSLRITI